MHSGSDSESAFHSELKPRVLGLDVGSRTIGMAVSDPLTLWPLSVAVMLRPLPTVFNVAVRVCTPLSLAWKV